jgi:hypothetical protein
VDKFPTGCSRFPKTVRLSGLSRAIMNSDEALALGLIAMADHKARAEVGSAGEVIEL